VSELYRSSGENVSETRAESSAADAAPASAAEWPEIDENTEQDIVLEQRLAEEERQFGGMTRQGEAEATWGRDADYGDYDDQSGEYDQDWDAMPGPDSSELTRQEEAETTWGPDADPGPAEESVPGEHDGDPATDEAKIGELSRQEEAETTWGDSSASALEAESAPPAITHYHSEYKDRTLDLYTDGTRWAAWDDSTPRPEDYIAHKGEIPPDRPPTGEELVEGAGEESSLADRLRRGLYERLDDETDQLDKDAHLVHDVFSHPPTGSYEGTPTATPHFDTPTHSGVDVGSGATALLALGLVLDRAGAWTMEHFKKHLRRTEDAGN
jgi:hypothetical protein